MQRYIYGWRIWFWILHKVRTKRRGAGPLSWQLAFKAAGAARYIVDGQHCGRPPHYWVDQKSEHKLWIG
jgi:hypothetical protein